MATRKRNEFLDADESDEEELQYDSEDESRSRMLRSTKRQKTAHTSDSEDVSDHPSDDDEDAPDDIEQEADSTVPTHDNDDQDAELARLEALAANLPAELRLGSNRLLDPLSTKPKKDKSGVIYLSRVPPFMKPAVLRSLLTPYGAIGKIFLTPESSTNRSQRLKSGGTRRKLFMDGWVEFLHKKDAKFVAESLNAQTMGGKKRSRWHDEVWNIKYLHGTKWSTLTEEIQKENAERAAKLRVEISKTKKENAQFLENVEKGKMISGIAAKRKSKAVDDEEVADEGGAEKPAKRERRSKFEQHAMKSRVEKKVDKTPQLENVLSSIF
jgi:ESF2/ABP1 family protein